jgi:hypothetical protein
MPTFPVEIPPGVTLSGYDPPTDSSPGDLWAQRDGELYRWGIAHRHDDGCIRLGWVKVPGGLASLRKEE